jgi:tetratricopeptide (TPR) repeat protein
MEDASLLEEGLALEHENIDAHQILTFQLIFQQSMNDPLLKLQFSTLLVKSKEEKDKLQGIKLFRELISQSYHVNECLYHLSLAYYSMADFSSARASIEELLRMDPDQIQARKVHRAIIWRQEKENTEVTTGVAWTIGIGVAATAALLFAKSLASKRR